MKKNILRAAVLFSALSIGPIASAHHSFAALFDASKPIRLKGTLTKVDWTNPHSYFYLDVVDSKGVTYNWAVEGAGPGALSRRGFKKGDVKIGDTLVVDGYLVKKPGVRLIDGRIVTLPDGRVINGGTEGDGGPGDTKPVEVQKDASTG
ncbi:DUF6152 family protein [Duganella qianjiadongensis]|uniref:OB-fold nucleic acid binding domain-containing protein n=1 Tax=Duganella qianjiadongensis TaxID=2692176 RepID=A0ABW9VEC2_9BURK|nr:DUF6152 family protein [Duganella qianjiadongensis]MYM37963.1 hypothetical protein [Duganella qianjiadongensis]